MLNKTKFYIHGEWVSPAVPQSFKVINPANEEPIAVISLGSKVDVDRAVESAQAAFVEWSSVQLEARATWLQQLLERYEARSDELAAAISNEMGAPIKFAKEEQVAAGAYHIRAFAEALKTFEFECRHEMLGSKAVLAHEPIGVCGLITPWNWPMNQVILKVVAAIIAGCTVVLKPSEVAPLSSLIFAEIVDSTQLPKGVFNLINGDGPGVGAEIASHPGIDMVSFTGSTTAGIAVSKAAADTVKRVALELGGKSPNIIFADSDIEAAVSRGAFAVFENTGQTCNAPTRMLIERSVYGRAVEIAGAAAKAVKIGVPSEYGEHIGPLVTKEHFDKVQRLISKGIEEGAQLVAGGEGRPSGFDKGYYVRPTVFAGVDNRMTIAQVEIFGPVLVMIPFDTEEEAIRIANDTPYGLAAYVQTSDSARIRRVSKQLRVGMVRINGASHAKGAPFGGYKKSGLGREGGVYGIMDFLEVKAISGAPETV